MKAIANLFCVLVLLTMLPGCRRAPSEGERALIALDSLIATNPDSALAQLLAVDTAALDEPCRAYRALLAAQARYKAYVRATDSTDITRAWRYYQHSGPYDRRIRAMIYRGTVAEELEHPDQAMCHYKQAEQYARPDDHYNRGYLKMRIANLYNGQYIRQDVTISNYRTAIAEFTLCHNDFYLMKCTTFLGMVYRTNNADSAVHYAEQAMEMAKAAGDEAEYFRNLESLAGMYHRLQDWEKAKTYAVQVAKYGPKLRELESCYYYASQSFCHLGNIDSARLLFQMAPPPTHVRDSILRYRTMELLDLQSNDYKSSATNARNADDVASQAIARKLRHDLQQIEYNQEKKQLEDVNHELSHVNAGLVLMIALILLAGGSVFAMGYRRFQDVSSQLADEQEALHKAQQQLGELREQLAQPAETGENKETDAVEGGAKDVEVAHDSNAELQHRQALLHLVDTVFNSVIYSGKRGSSLLKYVLETQKDESTSIMSIKLPPSFWKELDAYIDDTYPDAFTRMASSGIIVNEKEKRLMCLDCIRVPNALIALLLGYTERSASSVRFRIMEKLGCQGKTFDQHLQELAFA